MVSNGVALSPAVCSTWHPTLGIRYVETTAGPKLQQCWLSPDSSSESWRDVPIVPAPSPFPTVEIDANNGTFMAFRPGGKWYTTERGIVPDKLFNGVPRKHARGPIAEANGGCFPGLNSIGTTMFLIVIPDEENDVGFPLMIEPETAE